MRAARYIRVSTVRQADNTSISNQLDRTAAYIGGQGWKLAATFTEPGESGENLNRPALTAARQAAKRGEYDTLVVYTLDRLTRDIDDLFLLRREFKAAGVKIRAVHDGLDVTTADVDDLLGVLFKGYFGHREREIILRRMREGLERRVKAGKYPGGLPPYGYERGEDGRLAIQEETAGVVEMIYTWATEEQISSHRIAERLNALGTPSPWARRGIKRRRRDGTRHTPVWTSAVVIQILHAETYTGRWTYGKANPIVVEIPAIVGRAVWEKAQEVLKRNVRYTRPPKHRYLLRGLIRCECGARYCGYSPRREGGAHSYRCRARYDRRHGQCSHSLTIRGPELDDSIWSDIEAFIKQPHLVTAELNKRRGPAGEAIGARLAGVDQAMAERRTELDRYLTLYGRGTIPVEQLDAKAEEVRISLATLGVYRERLVEEERRADLWEREMAGIVESLQALQSRLAEGIAFEDKRAIVEMLVKGILIETHTDESGERYSMAHVTYRFERPGAEVPIPVELEPLFAGVQLAENCQIPPGSIR